MKITKRQLRRIIKEAMEPMTVDDVYDSLMGVQGFGPRKGLTRMDMAMDAIAAGDLQAASNAVMDALWIDNPPEGAEEKLARWLATVRTEDDLAAVAADWGTKYFRGGR